MTAPHGTVSRYNNHNCRCAECQQAQAKTQKQLRQRLSALPVPEHLHGRYSTYVNRLCRCGPCSRAAAAYKRQYKEKAKR